MDDSESAEEPSRTGRVPSAAVTPGYSETQNERSYAEEAASTEFKAERAAARRRRLTTYPSVRTHHADLEAQRHPLFNADGSMRIPPEDPRTRRDHAALAAFLENLETPISPQAAQRFAWTEEAYRQMEEDFGLLTDYEVRDLLDAESVESVAAMHQNGQLIGFTRRGQTVYPGYQFDGDQVLPVIPKVIAVANKYNLTQSELAQWLCGPTTYFEGDHRPVDHLKDGDRVAEVAESHFGIEW